MSHQLDFEKLNTYGVSDEGIYLDVEIKFVEVSLNFSAKIDTSAT